MAGTTLLAAITGIGAYLLAVRALRFRRMHSTLRRYQHLTSGPKALGQMTLLDAYTIQLLLAELEFPTTFSVAIFFALFKACPINYRPSSSPPN
jgi:hypothetical protein